MYRLKVLRYNFERCVHKKIMERDCLLKCDSENRKTFERERAQSWRTKQTINFNEQSERFRFLHFGGLLLAEDKGSFVGSNLTKGPLVPCTPSTTTATRDFSSSEPCEAFTYGIPSFVECNNITGHSCLK